MRLLDQYHPIDKRMGNHCIADSHVVAFLVIGVNQAASVIDRVVLHRQRLPDGRKGAKVEWDIGFLRCAIRMPVLAVISWNDEMHFLVGRWVAIVCHACDSLCKVICGVCGTHYKRYASGIEAFRGCGQFGDQVAGHNDGEPAEDVEGGGVVDHRERYRHKREGLVGEPWSQQEA